jgi:diguanylate cyclase
VAFEVVVLTVDIPALSAEAKRSVLIGTAAITLASVTASELVTFFISLAFGLNADTPAYLVAGVIPLFLAGIGSYSQLKRLEQVRAAYRELERVASTDWLTGVLNRQAFSTKATAASETGRPAAMLVVDADDLKTVNDRHGHEHGDDVLRRIAGAITANVATTDLVGRLGGEEFGVYLRVATESHAREVAGAIREAITDMAFAPGGTPEPLSVSIGIATADGSIPFLQLMRMAEQQLLAAKENGHNRISITAVPTEGKDRAAA